MTRDGLGGAWPFRVARRLGVWDVSLWRNVSIGISVRGIGLVASLVLGLLLTRSLGDEGYGVYAVAMSWAVLLALPAKMGLDQLLTREIGAARTTRDDKRMRQMVRWAAPRSIGLGTLIAVAAIVVGWPLTTGDGPSTLRWAFVIAALSVPITAWLVVAQGSLAGIGRVMQANGIVETLPHLLTALGCAIAIGWWAQSFGPVLAVAIAGMSVLASAGIGTLLARLQWPKPPQTVEATKPINRPALRRSAALLIIITGAAVVHTRTDILMLGAMTGEAAAGVYAIASFLAALTPLALSIAGTVYSPTMAGLIRKANTPALARLTSSIAAIGACWSIAFFVPVCLAGDHMLSIFGEAFVAGHVPLLILCIGNMAYSAAGPAGALLLMGGHDRSVAAITVASAAINVALNAILIPSLGTLGAAVATASSILTWNICATIEARRLYGFSPSIFPSCLR